MGYRTYTGFPNFIKNSNRDALQDLVSVLSSLFPPREHINLCEGETPKALCNYISQKWCKSKNLLSITMELYPCCHTVIKNDNGIHSFDDLWYLTRSQIYPRLRSDRQTLNKNLMSAKDNARN